MTIRWYGLVAPEETPTGDRRMFAAQALGYRDFPLPAAWQRTSGSGHGGSVVVASWDRQYAGQGGIWGAGEFLDPAVVPEAIEAMYLLQKKLIGPSVDLDPDLTYEIVPHPDDPDAFAMKVTKATVHGLTFVMSPAFSQVHITVDSDEEMAVLASAGISATFTVDSKSWNKFPLAPRETKFNFETAVANIAAWSGGDAAKFSTGFLWRDPDGDPNSRETYRLPIIDIYDGKAYLIPRAVFSAGVIMSGGHGGLYDVLNDQQRTEVQEVLTDIYDMLRQEYSDPRVVAPWQRGGRQGATSADAPPTEASLEPEEFSVIDDELDAYIESRVASALAEFAVRSSGWSGLPTSEGSWDESAARAALDSWAGDDMGKYGRAFLWSDGSGNKTGFKFPIAMPVNGKLTIFIRAVNNAKARLSQADIPAADKSRIESILTTIQKRYGGGDEQASLDQPTTDSGTLTAAGVLKPADYMFANPELRGPTPLTVDEDGHVFGHLATWRQCHMGVGNRCVMAPHSATGYKHFKQGSVLTASGKLVRVGKITIGTGHADEKFGVIPAVEHYDNTGTCVAVVNAGEDSFGVWVAGAVVDGVDETRVAELRRSPLSGDWRRVNGNLELVAALAVNSPGFPVLHEDVDGQYSLVAAGVLAPEPDGGLAEPVPALETGGHPATFAEVDAYLSGLDTARRVSVIEAAFHDLLPEEGCGCGV